MEDDEPCITNLSLGLNLGIGIGIEGYVPKKEKKEKNCLDLTFEFRAKEKDESFHVDHGFQHDNKAKGLSLKHPNEESPESKGSRKKLKLTKDQSTTLENYFKFHATLNPAQKQALAEQLNLKLRQVEVWFQNRRARTKLKQTEVDCEFLKKCCEKLREENWRLKKELQELRALKFGPYNDIQLSKATTMCSLCQGLLKKPNKEGNKTTVQNNTHNCKVT